MEDFAFWYLTQDSFFSRVMNPMCWKEKETQGRQLVASVSISALENFSV